METFRDFTKKLFIGQGYLVLGEIINGILFLKSSVHEDYWLIADGLECYDNQEDLFQSLQSKYYVKYPLAEKNTSLLILYDFKSEPIDRNRIIEIENDPIFFKKYVLGYTKESFEKMVALLGNSSLADAAMDNGFFSMMLNEGEFGPASLFYSIMHKLPFIPLTPKLVCRQGQDILYSGNSNAEELVNFLDNLPDEDEIIKHAVCNLIKVNSNE